VYEFYTQHTTSSILNVMLLLIMLHLFQPTRSASYNVFLDCKCIIGFTSVPHWIWAIPTFILNFKVLVKQSFSICFLPANCFMQISFHFFCKVCMTNMNIFFAWYLHVMYLHYKYIHTPTYYVLVHSMSIIQ
jgi:hypothetical protein